MLWAEPSSKSVNQKVSCAPCVSGAAAAGDRPDGTTPRSRTASSSRSLSGGRVADSFAVPGSLGLGTDGACTRGAGVCVTAGGESGTTVGTGSDVWGVGVVVELLEIGLISGVSVLRVWLWETALLGQGHLGLGRRYRSRRRRPGRWRRSWRCWPPFSE